MQKEDRVGISLVVLSGLCLTTSMVIAKFAAAMDITSYDLAYYRGLLSVGFFAIVWLFPFIRTPKPRYTAQLPKKKLAQMGVVLFFSGGLVNLLYYTLILQTQLTTVVAFSFVVPLVTSLVATAVLKERLGMRRLLAIGVGLMGTGLILKPGDITAGIIPLGIIYILASTGMRISSKMLSTRLRALQVSMIGTGGMFVVGLTTFLIHTRGSIPIMSFWAYVTVLAQVGLALSSYILLVGATTSSRHTSVVLSFDYLRILYVTLASYIFFGIGIDRIAWVGIALVLCSTIYLYLRESRLRARSLLRWPRSLRIIR